MQFRETRDPRDLQALIRETGVDERLDRTMLGLASDLGASLVPPILEALELKPEPRVQGALLSLLVATGVPEGVTISYVADGVEQGAWGAREHLAAAGPRGIELLRTRFDAIAAAPIRDEAANSRLIYLADLLTQLGGTLGPDRTALIESLDRADELAGRPDFQSPWHTSRAKRPSVVRPGEAPALLRALRTADAEERAGIELALEAAGPDVIPLVLEDLRAAHKGGHRQALVHILRCLNARGDGVLEVLLGGLEVDAPASCQDLASYGDRRVLPRLTRALAALSTRPPHEGRLLDLLSAAILYLGGRVDRSGGLSSAEPCWSRTLLTDEVAPFGQH